MFMADINENYNFQLVKIVCFKKDGGVLYRNGEVKCEIHSEKITDCNTVYGGLEPGDYRFEINGPATLYQFYEGNLVQKVPINKWMEFTVDKHIFKITKNGYENS